MISWMINEWSQKCIMIHCSSKLVLRQSSVSRAPAFHKECRVHYSLRPRPPSNSFRHALLPWLTQPMVTNDYQALCLRKVNHICYCYSTGHATTAMSIKPSELKAPLKQIWAPCLAPVYCSMHRACRLQNVYLIDTQISNSEPNSCKLRAQTIL